VQRRGFCAVLGRVCPEKGFHIAVDAATQAGMPLLIAGETFPYAEHVRYFEQEIIPRLDRERRWIGRAGPRRKARLLSSAQCLLIPSLIAETSSLVAMEALMCGTPVVAFRAGALPEIIEHGVTGYIVDEVSALAEAIGATRDLDRAQCRAVARERFSLQRSMAKYLALYERLVDA